jgi:hypothetical protein
MVNSLDPEFYRHSYHVTEMKPDRNYQKEFFII